MVRPVGGDDHHSVLSLVLGRDAVEVHSASGQGAGNLGNDADAVFGHDHDALHRGCVSGLRLLLLSRQAGFRWRQIVFRRRFATWTAAVSHQPVDGFEIDVGHGDDVGHLALGGNLPPVEDFRRLIGVCIDMMDLEGIWLSGIFSALNR